MSYEKTAAAERDIASILRHTLRTFGTVQFPIYARIIAQGMEMVGDDPYRPGSLDRSDIAPDVRMLHLDLAAGRSGAAAHCVFYTTGLMRNGVIGTIILRVLHERMAPRHRVTRALNLS